MALTQLFEFLAEVPGLIVLYILDPWIVEIAVILKVIVIPGVLLSMVPNMVWLERRGSAFMQDRLGPNRASIFGFRFAGFLHLFADAIKFFLKETFTPTQAHVFYYYLAPFVTVTTALLAYAVIPVSSSLTLFGKTIHLQIAHIDAGVLYILAVSSIGVICLGLAGWASNNKYSLMGGVRATAQMLSYEIPFALAVLAVVMVYGTLEPEQMIRWQEGLMFGFIPRWGIIVQPLGFILLLVAGFAECNRTPFDMPEGEPDLVAGYHTEYGSMKFSMFMLAEYVHMMTISSLLTTLYLGGYTLPWISSAVLTGFVGQWLACLIQLGVFCAKTMFFLWLFIWVRWTLPRFRYDQVMRLGWQNLIPLGVVNLAFTALILALPGLI